MLKRESIPKGMGVCVCERERERERGRERERERKCQLNYIFFAYSMCYCALLPLFFLNHIFWILEGSCKKCFDWIDTKDSMTKFQILNSNKLCSKLCLQPGWKSQEALCNSKNSLSFRYQSGLGECRKQGARLSTDRTQQGHAGQGTRWSLGEGNMSICQKG